MLRTNKLSLLIALIYMGSMGACSFKKDSVNKSDATVHQFETKETLPEFCHEDTSEDTNGDMLSLSSSQIESDLCLSWTLLKKETNESNILPYHNKVFTNLLRSLFLVSETMSSEQKKAYLNKFLNWATEYGFKNKAINQDLISLNNLTFNQLNNVKILNKDFLSSGLFPFAKTDELTLNQYEQYFSRLSEKTSLAEICKEDHLKNIFKSRSLGAATSLTLQICKTTFPASTLVYQRQIYAKLVHPSEISYVASAIESGFLIHNEDKSSINLGHIIATAVKRNDKNLFKLGEVAFPKAENKFYSLAMAEKIDYPLKDFVSTSSARLFLHIFSSQEINNCFKMDTCSSLLEYFKKSDVIPNESQTRDILSKLNRFSLYDFELNSLLAFYKLLRSNTVTGFTRLFNEFKLQDYELKMLERKRGSYEILSQIFNLKFEEEILGLNFSDDNSVYLTRSLGEDSVRLSGRLLLMRNFTDKKFENLDHHFGISLTHAGLTYLLRFKDSLEILESNTDFAEKIVCRNANAILDKECDSIPNEVIEKFKAVIKFL
ncbi:hypothetical protein [Bdellovibrio reynosensis]|uniref:Lipoprotein n=1 Tax=Bdellovibrio reynosensis TaxID=2835041 RepID=A0ABY4C5C2_9BACT|nr:hypothetical protein [Bdellovibrio reynosensis]UOF00019.1 hypothetical protein MNR06_09930 [Bdellovibrio reynosensis]